MMEETICTVLPLPSQSKSLFLGEAVIWLPTESHTRTQRVSSGTLFHILPFDSFTLFFLSSSLVDLSRLPHSSVYLGFGGGGGGGKMEGTFRQFHLDAVVLPSLASSVSSTSLPKMLKVIFLLHDSSLPFLLRPKFKKHSTPSIFLILLRRKILTNKI